MRITVNPENTVYFELFPREMMVTIPIDINIQKPTEEKYKNRSLMKVPIGKNKLETRIK